MNTFNSWICRLLGFHLGATRAPSYGDAWRSVQCKRCNITWSEKVKMSQCHEGYDRPCGEQCVYPKCDQGARHLSCPPDELHPEHSEQNGTLGYAIIPIGQELAFLAWDEVNTTGSGVHLYDDQIKDLLFSWWKELPGEIKEQIAGQF